MVLLLCYLAIRITSKAVSLILPCRVRHSLAVAAAAACFVVVLLKLDGAKYLVLLRLLGRDWCRLDRSLDL